MEYFFEKKEGPEFRVVGNVSEEIKKEVKKEYLGYLRENHLEYLSDEDKKELDALEYPKTEKELKAISLANEATNKLMEKVGVPSYNIPERNFHIVPPELYKKIAKQTEAFATTFFDHQAILINAEKVREINPLVSAIIFFHETMHLKGHFAIEVEEKQNEKEKKLEKTPFREGIRVTSAQKLGFNKKYHVHFIGLDEAIVSQAEKEFVKDILNHPDFKETKEWLDSLEAQKIKKEIAKNKNIKEEDIVWVSPDGKDFSEISYPNQREALNYIMEEIKKDFPEKYKNKEEVFLEFLKAHFSGKLLSLAKLVEKTFGKGSFRTLGMMGNDFSNTPLQILESLRRARATLKKSKSI